MDNHSTFKNAFEILGFPLTFDLEEAALEAAYLREQLKFHPDRFVHALPAMKRFATARAQEINKAYVCLKDPLLRASALIEAWGLSHQMSNPVKEMDLLMDVMAWRQRLDEKPVTKTEVTSLKNFFDEACRDFSQASPASPAALSTYRRLSYYGKLYEEARNKCSFN